MELSNIESSSCGHPAQALKAAKEQGYKCDDRFEFGAVTLFRFSTPSGLTIDHACIFSNMRDMASQDRQQLIRGIK